MRFLKIITVLAVASLFIGSGKKINKTYIVTFHEQGTEAEAPKFTKGFRLGSEGQPYYFSILPALTDKDIAWFYPFVSEDGRTYGTAFKFKDVAAQGLAGITKQTGKLLGIRVEDGPMTAVLIDRPVNDGIVVIWEGLEKKHLRMFQQRFPHVETVQKARAMAPANPAGR